MKVLFFTVLFSVLINSSAYTQDDFASITIKASGIPLTVKVNGTIIDKLEPRNMLVIGIKQGETKMIILEDSLGKKYAKEISAGAKDKGKNFFVQFPSNNLSKTEVVVAEEKKEPVSEEKNAKKAITPGAKNGINNSSESSSSRKNKIAALNGVLTNIGDGKLNMEDSLAQNTYLAVIEELKIAKENRSNDTTSLIKTIGLFEEIQSGKKPASKNLVVAINNNRGKDIPFFVNKNNIGSLTIDDVPLLLYALEKNSSFSVIKNIVDASEGDEKIINPFNYTFSKPYNNYYLTPLAKACINGDTNTINILIDKNARFYPEGLTKDHAVDQAKFLWEQFAWNKDVRLLISRRMPDFPNPEMDKSNAVASIINNMVLVEGGTYKMGCKGDRADCGNTWPLVEVSVKSFYILRYEVTQKIWETILESNPSVNATCENCPVENISWDEVQMFIQKINNLSERKFRLPSEKEWEYAAKGGPYSKGYQFAGSNVLDSVGWYKLNCSSSQPVGQKAPNELGLYDMTGNVYEWCSTFFSENLEIYKTSPEGATAGQEKMVRGGSYGKSEYSCGVIRRNNYNIKGKSPEIGFRLAMDVD